MFHSTEVRATESHTLRRFRFLRRWPAVLLYQRSHSLIPLSNLKHHLFASLVKLLRNLTSLSRPLPPMGRIVRFLFHAG